MAKKKISVGFTDPFGGAAALEGITLSKNEIEAHKEVTADANPLVKSVLNLLNGGNNTIERLAFESQPHLTTYGGLWRPKLRLLPDEVLKRISIQDDLVAAIANTRSGQISSFGRPQPDRFSTGMRIEPEPGHTEKLSSDQKSALQKRIAEVEAKFITCGQTKGFNDDDSMNLSQFLFVSARNAIIFGRIATEMIYTADGPDGRNFHSFRPIDAGTIFKAAPQRAEADAVRKQALHLLESLKNKRLNPERYVADEYTWIQVIDGRPTQAFTSDECLVHNFYPTTDVELDGYPLTPLDTVITAVTTHINIGTHNKLYFQSGRAARGMIVIKSEEIDEEAIGAIRQQFNASINSVSNSWRMPIFSVGPTDEISWQSIDNSGRDMEFQYLSDTNARVILSAFQMSPEEIPGYSHLSRGTNSQALSECISMNSLVFSPKGLVSVESILGSEKEAFTPIWDGSRWVEGRVFRSGPKRLMETEVESGMTIQTSPDHRFRVLDDEGTLTWKKQEELAIDDYVVMNSEPVKGVSAIPHFKGRPVDEKMMEILGWVLGDGTIVAPLQRVGGSVHMFYHHEREVDIWERHDAFLKEWNINSHKQKIVVTEEQKEKIKAERGFKTVADFRLKNMIYDTDFVRWATDDFGFNPSKEGKTIPPIVFTLPVELRQAFLRGFFSADAGKLNETGSVALTVQDDHVREQTKHLLLGLGIRVLPCKGVLRESFGKKSFSHKLFIKDRKEFWERVGFVQPYKQHLEKSVEMWSIGDLPASLRRRFLKECVASEGFKLLPKKERDNAISCIRPGATRNCSMNYLMRTMESCGLKVPQELTSVHYERVSALRDLDKTEEMADVEMFSDSHAFICQGFQVHNSNSEYKLEAHRDGGIRPLLAQFQNFLNARILPLLAPDLAMFCSLKFVGLDAETAEKESTRLQQDLAVHMTMDEVLEKVEKHPIGQRWGGHFLLNPQWQAIIDKYFLQGEIMEHFFGIKDASKDPRFQFVNNPNWFQWQQLQMQQQQMQQQAQQQQQQAQQPQQGQPQEGEQGQDLTRSIDQLGAVLTKGESQLSASKRGLLMHQRKTVESALQSLEEDAKQAAKAIVEIAHQHLPTKLKK